MAHRHPDGTPVQRIGTRGCHEDGVGPQGGGRAEDGADVRVVDQVDQQLATPEGARELAAALAWNLAAQQPALIKQLLIINSPHPAAFLRELRHNPAQQAASAYMNFLCRPDAGQRLAERDFARLWPFLGNPAWLDADLMPSPITAAVQP